MGLSIKEAAKLVGKSTRTVKAWKRQGVDITDTKELTEFSQLKDAKARGSSAILARRRLDHKPSIATSSDLRSFFNGVSQDESFVELPSPYDPSLSERVLAALDSMRDAFSLRLDELKVIGYPHSIELAEKDLAAVTESHRLLAMALEGFGA